MTTPNGRLVDVDDLHVEFRTGGRTVEAISGVSLQIDAGETVAVVGESGSGKSVTALAILGLLGNGRISGGTVTWDGEEITHATRQQLRRIRGNDISIVFQDPMTALDPLFTIGSQLREAIQVHQRLSRKEARARAVELLSQVGIPDPESKIDAYPHQLSGGQRQRVMIAGALACSPRLLIADEPTTALDVTVEAQVLRLIRDLQRETGVALMLITHDMGVVAEMADRVVVFYAGEVVETGTAEQILSDPRHPYTQALLRAIPRPDTPRDEPMPAIPGQVPGLDVMPQGCRFASRCPLSDGDRCLEPQALLDIEDRHARCWRAGTGTPEAVHLAGAVR
ncbi:ABC transporter ATP-binding protein [Aeromicrobium duanguangcaii]|uniref:ABC transporter ATP-binding protein n=1 Tax=Aeromicrobium duanguangcaii TaxID=2968086 RepID=A0ABY5KDS2_9ACTN|nr:ABC transporter ATP-binding protein [Aeromicrobium duanguangcaii]MCD9154500.1 ABC transporter ATP-binding protein [Aeromicrobium duanguangcaii]MCL3838248.1 ABC transporter ATP-binding protein [Aeromicrobium duanguangcaii]UUI68444.1 ABC transporter ATP-binding protein [Aeromicrobium duanguangcaii]